MSSLIHQPMDKLFKQSMEEIKVAREFFETHLPADLLKKLDLSTLKLENNSFVDEMSKSTAADVLYSGRMGNTTAYFYILCEHQSTVDDEIAFRLLVYTIRIMERHKKQFPKSALPLVYPWVVYSGKKPWSAPRDIFSLFGDEEAMARNYLFKPYQLLDIYRTPDEELRRHAWCGLMGFALKYRKAQDFARLLDILFPWIREISIQDLRGEALSRIMLRYVIDSMETSDAELFIQKSNQYLSSNLRGEAMTLAQEFERRGVEKGIQEGMQQGIQQGMQRGIQQGKQEGEKAFLLRLLQRKFGEIPTHYHKQIENADANMLLELADAVLNAETLAELFE